MDTLARIGRLSTSPVVTDPSRCQREEVLKRVEMEKIVRANTKQHETETERQGSGRRRNNFITGARHVISISKNHVQM